MNSVLLRSTGLTALTLSLFFGCGGRIEAEYEASDSGLHESPLCGNGKLDSGEQCDGNKLNGATCGSVTMGSRPNGVLSCSDRCRLDASKCTGSGNGGTGGGPNGTGGRPNNGGRPNGTGGVLGTGGSVAASGCTASADCRNGQVCCGTRNGAQYAFACARTCGQNSIEAECSQASDCNRGQVCCGTTNQMGTAYTSIACARTCTANGEYPLCASNAECGQGRTCQTSQILPPAFKVCR
jgi:hypothetical protein